MLRSRPVVLMYHRIADERVDPWGLAVTADRFDEQLAWLRRHRTVLPLVEFAERHGRGSLPARAVAITFDDGYACNADVAAPLLEHHQLPATMFLATETIVRCEEFWWDDLERIVLDTGCDRLVLEHAGRELVAELGPLSATRMWSPREPASGARQAAYLALWSELRQLDDHSRRAAIGSLHEQSGVPVAPRATHRTMTVEQVRMLSRSGIVQVGAHTLTHPALSLWSKEQQEHEVVAGRRACAELTGVEPQSFAYPYGDYDQVTVDVVRRAGFRVACTTHRHAVSPSSQVWELPRVQVSNWSGRQLASALRTVP